MVISSGKPNRKIEKERKKKEIMGAGAQWDDSSQQENKASFWKEDMKLSFSNLGKQKLRRNILL